MYHKLFILFLALMLTGSILTAILYRFDFSKIKNKELDKKILSWIPIALIFLLILYIGRAAQLAIFIAIILISSFEFYKNLKKQQLNNLIIVYLLLFNFSFAFLPEILLLKGSEILIFIMFGTVMSDIFGFFFGNFFGFYKLPKIFNQNKSYDGLLGQLIGAYIGVWLIKYFITNQENIMIFLPIGLGSIAGDLLNSAIKTRLKIKNWSNYIPGHGGFIDRFCSLAGGSLFLYCYFILKN